MSQAAARRNTRSDSRKSGFDADRIALVDQLWKLKKHWQEHTGSHVPLNVLIKEVDYRRDVLNGAERSGKPELAELARRIRAIEERIGEISSITEAHAARETPRLLWGAVVAALAGVLVLAGLLVDRSAFTPPAYALPASEPAIAFRLHGSNTVGEELAPALLESFFKSRDALETLLVGSNVPVEKQLQFILPDNPEQPLAVEIHAHGSTTAFRDLAAGSADIGMSSRPIKAAEVEQLAPRYGNLSALGSEHVIALDGLAVIVHPANPLDNLSTAEVAAIFSGQVRDWAELGAPQGAINLYARDDNSGTFDTFKSLVLKANGVALSAAAQRFESSTELSDAVAADPNGIGFIGLPYVRNAKALGIAESADTQPVVPTEFTVSTEDYPLSRRLFFYVPANTDNRTIRDFVEFTLSDAGQAVVEQVGLVSQRVRLERPRPRADAPARFTELTAGAQRLSVTFRFAPQSDRLDNKSMRDIERVVEFMKQHRERELLLLGFTDAGDVASSLALSRGRAKTVAQMLMARGLYPAAVEGFGAVLPVASNDTVAGRQKNRRVEVWVR